MGGGGGGGGRGFERTPETPLDPPLLDQKDLFEVVECFSCFL